MFRGRRPKKIGGAQVTLTPPGPVGGGQRFFPPFFLPPFAVFFAISSSLERGSSALLLVTKGYHRWAERSTLIQDVDYG